MCLYWVGVNPSNQEAGTITIWIFLTQTTYEIIQMWKSREEMGLTPYRKLFTSSFFVFERFYFKEVNVEWKRLAAGLVPSINHDQDPVDVETHSHMPSVNRSTSGHIRGTNFYQPANIRTLNRTAFVKSHGCTRSPQVLPAPPHVRWNKMPNKVRLRLNWPLEPMRRQIGPSCQSRPT